jgi:hypothetical protein
VGTGNGRIAGQLPGTFPGDEEERLLLADQSAERCAVLVRQILAACREEVRALKALFRRSNRLPYCAVPDRVDIVIDAAGGMAESARMVINDHAEFCIVYRKAGELLGT